MSTEALYNRREFLTFAHKRSKHPNRQSHFGKTNPRPFSSQPGQSGIGFTKRELIIGSLVVVGGVAVGLSRPWEQFTPVETLESLVTEAKRMEDEYQNNNLSNKPVREKYADILAGIFTFHNPGDLTRPQLKEAITFTDTLDQFVRERMASDGRTGNPTLQQLANERFTTAATDNRQRKITVNTASEAFKKQNVALMKNVPQNWNSLKMLRISLLHEFNHLVIESEDEVIFSIIDPNNKIKDKRIEGFRIIGIDKIGKLAVVFTDLHEAAIEFFAKKLSLADFGSHLSNFQSDVTGEDVTALMGCLEQILGVIGMTYEELTKLHKKSNLRQFLLTLSDKAGVSPNISLEDRIKFGSVIAGAIERNDQRILQNYINQVK
ncbi:MAG: hypothetical protein Q7R97_00360 [Candidatus Daviesbacteria bacterium]|nr:hypothetical protein [Candidatus Daviesbacteria bacterium]